MSQDVVSVYQQSLKRRGFVSDSSQWRAVERLQRLHDELTARDGVLGLPLIRNVKTVDPKDSSSPEVYQIESAMGAAVEVFEGAQAIEVPRSRFLPVKTTNELMLLRSDVYDLGADFVLDQVAEQVPYVDLEDRYYKLVGEFDRRFSEGAPSLREATSFTVAGDWSFGAEVRVVGTAELEPTTTARRVEPGTVIGGGDE